MQSDFSVFLETVEFRQENFVVFVHGCREDPLRNDPQTFIAIFANLTGNLNFISTPKEVWFFFGNAQFSFSSIFSGSGEETKAGGHLSDLMQHLCCFWSQLGSISVRSKQCHLSAFVSSWQRYSKKIRSKEAVKTTTDPQ